MNGDSWSTSIGNVGVAWLTQHYLWWLVVLPTLHMFYGQQVMVGVMLVDHQVVLGNTNITYEQW